MTATAYPLSWPAQFPRAKSQERGALKATLSGALTNVDDVSERDITTLHRSGRGHYDLQGMTDGSQLARVGKKAAGRLLDGVEHKGFPA